MASAEVLLAAVQLILVHMLDGREVLVNTAAITRLMPGRPDDDPKRILVKGVHCVLFFANGSYLSVTEGCPKVRELIGKE